jgi:hypothetical protein
VAMIAIVGAVSADCVDVKQAHCHTAEAAAQHGPSPDDDGSLAPQSVKRTAKVPWWGGDGEQQAEGGCNRDHDA